MLNRPYAFVGNRVYNCIIGQKFGSGVAVRATTCVNTVLLLVGHFVLGPQFLSCSVIPGPQIYSHSQLEAISATYRCSLHCAKMSSQLSSSKSLYFNLRLHTSMSLKSACIRVCH